MSGATTSGNAVENNGSLSYLANPSIATPATALSTNPSSHPLAIPKPLPVTRQQSGTMEHYRQTIAEIISQIR